MKDEQMRKEFWAWAQGRTFKGEEEADVIEEVALEAWQAAKASGWRDIKDSDKTPDNLITVPLTLKWSPYKPTSEQYRKGIKGRWQQYNGFGWENTSYKPQYFLPTPPNTNNKG